MEFVEEEPSRFVITVSERGEKEEEAAEEEEEEEEEDEEEEEGSYSLFSDAYLLFIPFSAIHHTRIFLTAANI
jgi:CRISPR/Cas system CMR subunit Cmr4 (Cas7 group RAMP superfamily)